MLRKPTRVGAEAFVRLLTEAQFDLHAFLSYLIGNTTDAYDVLQETNLILWRKAQEYDAQRPFLNWARTFAHFQALKFRKSRQRDRLIFDDDLLQQAVVLAEGETAHQRLLEHMEICFSRLTPGQREVMLAKYNRKESLAAIAQRMECSVAAVGMLLMRIRKRLAQCVREAVAREAAT